MLPLLLFCSFLFFSFLFFSSITAYVRIKIDPFKRIPGNECFYSDTYSVFLQYPLSDSFINNEIGNM